MKDQAATSASLQFNIQHSPFNIQHSPSTLQPAFYATWHKPSHIHSPLTLQRNAQRDDCALSIDTFDVHRRADLAGPLAHTHQPEAGAPAQIISGDPPSVIPDVHEHLIAPRAHADLDAGGVGVTGYVRHRLLHDAIGGRLDVRRHRQRPGWQGELALDARSLLEGANVRLQRGQDAEVVQGRRAQLRGKAVCGLDDVVQGAPYAPDHRLELGLRRHGLNEPPYIDLQRGKALAEVVMNLAGDACALFLLHLQKALG